mmetsp:Transcript_116996/g.325303  ORF Transcript_116996/g.325303 Transcript_116996/m.325303 type:complete len:336 (-) Transcript_116996:367-1374(-)
MRTRSHARAPRCLAATKPRLKALRNMPSHSSLCLGSALGLGGRDRGLGRWRRHGRRIAFAVGLAALRLRRWLGRSLACGGALGRCLLARSSQTGSGRGGRSLLLGQLPPRFKPRAGVRRRGLGLVLEKHEEALQLCHAHALALGHRRELLRERLLAREEAREHPVELQLRREADVDVEVYPAGPHQRPRKPPEVVRRHEHDPLLRRDDAVQGVEEAAEAHPHHPGVRTRRVGRCCLADREVNVFEQNQAPRRHHRQKVLHPVVRHAGITQVKDADVVSEFAGESCDERRLAATGRAVQEVAAPVRNASVEIPFLAGQELLHIPQDLPGGVAIQDH